LHRARAFDDRDTVHFAASGAIPVDRLDGRIVRELAEHEVRKFHDFAAHDAQLPAALPAQLSDGVTQVRSRLERHDHAGHAGAALVRTIIELAVKLGMIAGLAAPVIDPRGLLRRTGGIDPRGPREHADTPRL